MLLLFLYTFADALRDVYILYGRRGRRCAKERGCVRGDEYGLQKRWTRIRGALYLEDSFAIDGISCPCGCNACLYRETTKQQVSALCKTCQTFPEFDGTPSTSEDEILLRYV
jgi:hypothetical protein